MITRKAFPLELKALKDRQFEGYLSTFGNVDHGGDIVVSGAFKATLADHRKNKTLPAMLWMHQMDRVPGKWLSMQEDDDGLWVKGELAKTPLGDEMHELLKFEAVRGMSIGFYTKKWDYTKDGYRLIKEAELVEGSIVTLGMNPLATIQGVKSRLSNAGEYVPGIAEFKRKIEDYLRDEGCPSRVAKRLVSNMFAGESIATIDGEAELRDEGGAIPEEAKDLFQSAAGLVDALRGATISELFKKTR